MGRVWCGRIRFFNIHNRGEKPATAGDGRGRVCLSMRWRRPPRRMRHFDILGSGSAPVCGSSWWLFSPLSRQEPHKKSFRLIAREQKREDRGSLRSLPFPRRLLTACQLGLLYPPIDVMEPQTAVGRTAYVTRRGKDFEGPDEGGFCAWCEACGGPARGLMHCT
jgi:hypothetical protein